MTIPIIRLEVEGMQQTITMALREHQAQMESDIQAAIADYCTPENITQIIREAASKALTWAIREEVATFFRAGHGRTAVAAAVKEALLHNETYTPLDDVESAS